MTIEEFKDKVQQKASSSPKDFGKWYAQALPKMRAHFNTPELEEIHRNAIAIINVVNRKPVEPFVVAVATSQRAFEQKTISDKDIDLGTFVPLPAECFPLVASADTVVTFNQFDAFCYMTGRDLANDQNYGRDDRPAINLEILNAIAYINWLNDMHGKPMPYIMKEYNGQWWFWYNPAIRGHAVFLFPTKAEWTTIAADHAENLDTRTDIQEIAWTTAEMGGKTQPVKKKKPNKYGIYDTVGNVWKMAVPDNLPYMDEDIWKDKFPKEEYMTNIFFY